MEYGFIYSVCHFIFIAQVFSDFQLIIILQNIYLPICKSSLTWNTFPESFLPLFVLFSFRSLLSTLFSHALYIPICLVNNFTIRHLLQNWIVGSWVSIAKHIFILQPFCSTQPFKKCNSCFHVARTSCMVYFTYMWCFTFLIPRIIHFHAPERTSTSRPLFVSKELAVTKSLWEEYPHFCQVLSMEIPHSPASLSSSSFMCVALFIMLYVAHCYATGKSFLFCILQKLSSLGGGGIFRALVKDNIAAWPLRMSLKAKTARTFTYETPLVFSKCWNKTSIHNPHIAVRCNEQNHASSSC